MQTRIWLAAVAASLPITVVVGWGIGLAATPTGKPYAWEVATLAATAAGTLSLAIVTGLLAVMTAREVRLTGSIETERHRPVLVEVPAYRSVGFLQSSGPTTGTLDISLRNVGLGPALDVQVEAKAPESVAGEVVESVGMGRIEAISVESAEAQPVLVRVPITVTLPEDHGLSVRQYEELAKGFRISLVCMDRTRTLIRDALVQTESP